jgi:hypothetical protein
MQDKKTPSTLHTDTIDKSPHRTLPPTNRGIPLPAQEKDRPLSAQLDDLKVQIDELVSALQYMGELHPRKKSMEQELLRLRAAYNNLHNLQDISKNEGEI